MLDLARAVALSQGSEIANLAYVVGIAGRQNWQHVYTAVTRGKESVTIITDSNELFKSVTSPHQRRYVKRSWHCWGYIGHLEQTFALNTHTLFILDGLCYTRSAEHNICSCGWRL